MAQGSLQSRRESAISRGYDGGRSYIGPAILTFLLYYVGFYIVGLIVNVLYLTESGRQRAATGVNPSGRGCLILLLVLHVVVPLLVVGVVIVLAMLGMLGEFLPVTAN